MRLTSNQVKDIFLSRASTSELALTYEVSTNTIRSIKRRRSHTGVTGLSSLTPGKPKSNRHILDDETVREIFERSETLFWFKSNFGVSKQVVTNIKFRHTYVGVTDGLGEPGEIRVHALTWDDVCTIRASTKRTDVLADMFGVTRGTINNIRQGRTRLLK